MERKRKPGRGDADASIRRKRKIGGMGAGDHHYHNAFEDTIRRSESPLNSDTAEPQVKGIIKVELGSELRPNLLANGNNQQEIAGDCSNQVSDIDIGEVEVKLLYSEDELMFQVEDTDVLDSNMTEEPQNGMASRDPELGEGLQTTTSISNSSECDVGTTECENFAATGEKENTEVEVISEGSSHSGYWKLKAEEVTLQKLESDKKAQDLEVELAIQKLKLEKKARDLETELAIQKLEFGKKTRDLEADRDYWKSKAKELERNVLEGLERAEPVELAGPHFDAVNCHVTTEQSTTTGYSKISTCSILTSVHKSSDKDKRNNADDSFSDTKAGERRLRSRTVTSNKELCRRSKKKLPALKIARGGHRKTEPAGPTLLPTRKLSHRPKIADPASATTTTSTSRQLRPRRTRSVTPITETSRVVARRKRVPSLSPSQKRAYVDRLVQEAAIKKKTPYNKTDKRVKRDLGRPKNREWKCPECPVIFVNIHNFKMHVARVHAKCKDVPCKYPGCNRMFSTKCDLASHSRCHLGKTERVRYQCPSCKRQFSHLFNVRRHMSNPNNFCRVLPFLRIEPSVQNQGTAKDSPETERVGNDVEDKSNQDADWDETLINDTADKSATENSDGEADESTEDS